MDPRQKRTREAIIGAGQRLFSEHKPDLVSMDDIVRAAKISKQSFYNHFADKQDLTSELLKIARAELDALVEEANQGETDPAKRLANGLCIYAAQAFVKPASIQISLAAGLDELGIDTPANAHIVEDLKTGLLKRRLNALTLETALAFTVGAGSGLVSRIIKEQNGELAVIRSQQFVTLVLRAFGLNPAEAESIASDAAERLVRPIVFSTP